MPRDSTRTPIISDRQAVYLFDAVREFMNTWDSSKASDTVREVWFGVTDVIDDIEENQ